MASFKIFRNDLPIFETHLNDGEDVFFIDVDGGSEAWIGASPPADQEIAEVANVEMTEPGLFVPFDEMSVEELKGLLRDKDMPVSGTKAELVERLTGE